MESPIILLDEHTDQATKQMLQHVVNKKKKFDLLKKKHSISIWGSLISGTIVFIYLYFSLNNENAYSFLTAFPLISERSVHITFIALTIGLYGHMIRMKKKVDKAEKEYQAMRTEIINKSKLLWEKEIEWKNRHKVFEMMKKNYGINLYHENK